VSETFDVGVRRGVSPPRLWDVSVSSGALRHVMPWFANTIRLWANTPSPIAAWKCLNPR